MKPWGGIDTEKPTAAVTAAFLALLALVVSVGGLTACDPDAGVEDPTELAATGTAPTGPIESGSADEQETPANFGTYPVVDTGQERFFSATGEEIPAPDPGDPLDGQDARTARNPASYTDGGNGTVTDDVTGLVWSANPDLDGDGEIDADDKLGYEEALATADELTLAGFDDWRLPTIEELYSLIDFSGLDPVGPQAPERSGLVPFIDTDHFAFAYGDESAGERTIDAQFATSTLYGGTTMGGNETMFSVDFADGRVKGYPAESLPGRPQAKRYYVYFVRGNPAYGENAFVDNGDGTITDDATGLTWSQADSGEGMDWPTALAWVQRLNEEEYLGHDDWRLPDAKELQSIVDYGRGPDSTDSAAIDPLFECTPVTNEAGEPDFGYYWTSTTHASPAEPPGENAVYIAFGRAMGYWNGEWTDVHGAGAQRSDPKVGDPSYWPTGRGPQGDAIRIENLVRPVRGGM